MHSTQSTAETGRDLLGSLTDEELTRYGEIAGDQYRREARLSWAQAVLALAAVAAALWALRSLLVTESTRLGLLALGLSAALGYWPWRKARSRRLWREHCRAVAEEQGRRGRADEGETSQ